MSKPTLIDPHRYEKPSADAKTTNSNELGFLRIRYKKPGEDKSILLQEALLTSNSKSSINQTSADFRFAASVAGFGLSLRDSKYLGDYSMDTLIGLAKSGLGNDDGGYRAEFVRLMKTAQELSLQKPATKAE